MSAENKLGKQNFTGHMERIKESYPGILPRQTNYAAIGPVYIGDMNRMKQLAEGKIDGTWEKRPLARRLASVVLAETERVMADIDLHDPVVVEEVVRQETRFYADPDFRAGKKGPTIAAAVARVVLFETGK